MPWKPIEDIPDPEEALEVSELRALDELWSEQRSELERMDGMKRFRDRLARSWAIETGVIERVFDLDRGTTDLLIEKGIDADLIDRESTNMEPRLVGRIIRDHQDAIEGLFTFIKRERELSTSYVKELHATLTQSQERVEALDQFGTLVEVPLLRGAWKELPNNPRRPDGTVHVYCPPEHVDSEMDRLIELHMTHDRRRVKPEVEAAWLHHRFTQIHPFQDGNGRVARALATLVFLRAGWFPLTVDRDRKAGYIEALEAADLGDLRHLVQMFGALQRNELVRALGIGDQTARETRGVEEIIRAAQEDIVGPVGPAAKEQLDQVRGTADLLLEQARERLGQIKQSIDTEISEHRPQFSARVESATAGDERAQFYRGPVFNMARRGGYFANVGAYQAWVRLGISDKEASTFDDLVLSFHAIGREFRGVIAVSALYQQHQVSADGVKRERRLTDSYDVPADLFQINPREAPQEAAERFRDWLEEVMTIGLDRWRLSLARSIG